MIEEVEKSSIIIKKCLMNCDGDFGDLSAPLPNKSFFWIIAGPGGSGKTNLLQNLFRPRNFRNYFKKFENIIIASPPSSTRIREIWPIILRPIFPKCEENVLPLYDHENGACIAILHAVNDTAQ